ncbi:MAG TPA: VPLPA-CTERM sorting domain-containing protein [Gammaproteobacteria bacterium]|nr:VPLPA-CTERM sorting domain-containing protein [Gammaproteobacteria bacterium]
MTGVFNDSGLTGTGAESVLFSAGSGNNLNIVVGSMSFTEADDVDYLLGSSPALSFLDGAFNGFDFLAYFGEVGQFESTIFSAGAMDDGFNVVNSTWTNYSVAPVPVPAALWLFGSGLLGLAGIARRKS